ncbi:MAG: TaqI-like C-terminal specificity domain-containing protein [Candidatus Fimisoma sp.]
MAFISVKEAAERFSISERRVQKLCEEKRIPGATMVSGIWLIPEDSSKPKDARVKSQVSDNRLLSLKELCASISISEATGKNWLRLGKISPETFISDAPYFSQEYVRLLKKDILSGKNSALKSRRNKKYVSGNGVYKSYISPSSINNEPAETLIGRAAGVELSDETISYIVAEAAIRLLCQARLQISDCRRFSSFLMAYFNEEIDLKIYKSLIDDMILSQDNAKEFISRNPSLFDIGFQYEKKEDILGLIYISLKNAGERKATGSYYTPNNVVKKLIDNLSEAVESFDGKKILDPCCGTGNFLLQLPENIQIRYIYGRDIDLNSVKIARLNLALRCNVSSTETIYEHIVQQDFLAVENGEKYDMIIGNPPWGYDFTEEEKTYLRTAYSCMRGKNAESYDAFIEQSLKHLSKKGMVSFVLPEAILNVRTHRPVRALILEKADITCLEYLGNVFDQVQCPCIILQLDRKEGINREPEIKVKSSERSFVISTGRNVCAECFSFTTTDDEYRILNKLIGGSDKAFLLDNADFALGIVTGDNKKYITHIADEVNEPVLKGSDILKYRVRETDNYISFTPERFQQVAPEEYYRAPEKLLYRFICNQPVFAYDDRQTLSLNSCNVVIPRFENLHIKYIMAILNSRIAQFVFEKSFNSIKILRSHIERMPIPMLDAESQTVFASLADELMACSEKEDISRIYDEIDVLAADAFGLERSEYDIVKKSVEGRNGFLY